MSVLDGVLTGALPSVVTAEELARRWHQDDDRRAREDLFVRWLPLAGKLARRYASSFEPIEDLVQVASVGLLAAIDRFDPGRGSQFSSFAIPTILGELKRYFRSTGWSVHVPRGAQEMAMRIDRAVRELTEQSGRSPRVNALAEYLNVSVEEVLVGLDARSAHFSTSLDAPATGPQVENCPPLVESLGGADDRFALVDFKVSLEAAIGRLPYQERRALTLRLHAEMTQAQIAAQLGCSQMQVSRLLHRAADNLRTLTDPDLRSAME